MANYMLLPVDKIKLDLNNPRIAKWIEMYGNNVNSSQMALALGAGDSGGDQAGPTFSSLKQSILTNRGIIYPIIVNRESNGNLVVIEGNTRTLIYKEFNESNVPGEWNQIPSIVYDNMSKQMIDAIRLQIHLVGARSWDPYSKAKYLDFLSNQQHLPYSQIIDFCGGKQREVENYIKAYRDMEQHYRPILESDSDFDSTRFSAFVELQDGRVLDSLQRNGFTKTDFSKWVHERKIYPLQTVRELPRILTNPRSKEVFLRSGAVEARKILDVVTNTTQSLSDASLDQLAKEISRRISSIPFSEVQRLRAGGRNDENDVLLSAKEALVEFCKEITEDERIN